MGYYTSSWSLACTIKIVLSWISTMFGNQLDISTVCVLMNFVQGKFMFGKDWLYIWKYLFIYITDYFMFLVVLQTNIKMFIVLCFLHTVP